MADSIYTFDPVAANNTSLDTIPYGPNQLYHNQIDNWFRSLGSKLAQFVDDLGAVNTVAGTGDAVTVTLSSGITAYATGQLFRFVAGAANTGAATINVNGLGAKAIRKISGGTDVALAASDIAAGETYLLIYRAAANAAAGAFVIVGSSAAVADASTTQKGIAELATQTEAATLTDTTRIVTPDGLFFLGGYATTATAAGTTTLTVTSTFNQVFTGSTTQTVVLPVTSTLVLGRSFRIINNSTGAVTVQSSGTNAIAVIPPSSALVVECILTSGTTAASWTIVTPASGALRTATTIVGVSASAAPSSGDVLTATSSTAATWQAPASGGQPVPTASPYDVNTLAMLKVASGAGANNNSTAAGSTLQTVFLSNSSGDVGTGGVQSGTWKNVSGVNLGNTQSGMWVRTV